MQQSPPPSPLLVVLGPTGAGKSELAITLAQSFSGEIISCDSIQVYRGLDIGSAKIAPAERHGIPHHLVDVMDLTQELTAGAYSRLAAKAIRDVQSRQHVPILTGGTGFYLRALLVGLSPAPEADKTLRQRLHQCVARRPAVLHRFLHRFDPRAAARIHRNDHQKLIRAVELTLLARRPASHTQDQPRHVLTDSNVLKIGLAPSRQRLYERLNQRCTKMFENGLLDEVRSLLAAGYSPDLKPLQSVGYKQALKHLNGAASYTEALIECQAKTRQYAKRQVTWFRRESDVHWLTGFGADPEVQAQAVELTHELLAL